MGYSSLSTNSRSSGSITLQKSRSKLSQSFDRWFQSCLTWQLDSSSAASFFDWWASDKLTLGSNPFFCSLARASLAWNKKSTKNFWILRRGVKITSVCSTFLVALLLIIILGYYFCHYQIVLHTWLLLLHFSMGPDVQLGSHDAEEIVKATSM